MIVLKNIQQAQVIFKNIRTKRQTIGFVPTMGALHNAHEQIILRSKKESSVTVVSIFVNPLQFGPKEDFNKYPKPFNKDLSICKKLKVDYVFAPTIKQMYPDKIVYTNISVKKYTGILCDKFRPGHFNGVATVVTKLFNIINPTKAYFGEKDYQQLLVIKQLVKDLNFTIDIVPCETFREPDGLAFSSRNKYLSKTERNQANVIYKSLLYCKQLILTKKFSLSKCINYSKIFLNKNILLPHKIQYFEIYDNNLSPVNNDVKQIKPNTTLRIFVAVYLGKTRLIDNMPVNI